MKVVCTVWLLAASLALSSADVHGKKAAEAIWRHSKRWKLTAKRPGGGKAEKLRIKMVLTGKLKGAVADFTAELKAKVGGKPCTVRFGGALGKGSYRFVKTTAVVGGELVVRLTGSSCELPPDFKEKYRIPRLPLRMFLVRGKLCPGIGDRPMTKTNCFKRGR